MNENPAVYLNKTRINVSVMFCFGRVSDFLNQKANLILSESTFHNKTVITEYKKYVLLPEIKDIWKNQHNVLHIYLLHVNWEFGNRVIKADLEAITLCKRRWQQRKSDSVPHRGKQQ